MNLKLLLAFFVSLGLVFPLAPAAAEQRVALVIGNGAYEKAETLPNPKNDAEDVAAALKRAGFETIVGIDLNKADMEDATIRFARKARNADVALFYYSGHALQFGGVNYLLPVDADLKDEADLRRMARLDQIVQDLQRAKNLRILVLDSCRDNPLAEQLKRSIGLTRAASLQRGLARIDSPQGMIVAFATQAGLTAADGSGRNSPYTTAFLNHIETKEEIGRVFRRIAAQVYDATGRAQLPELSLSLIGEYYLYGKPQNPALPTDNACSIWPQIRATKSATEVKGFLTACQSGTYNAMAKARLSELERQDVAAIDTPPQRALSEPGPKDEPKTPKNVDVGCKKYFPSVGMTFTVPCGEDASAPNLSTSMHQDEALWATIKGSDKVSDFEFYLRKFPEGRYSAVAELKVKHLKKEKVPVGAYPEQPKLAKLPPHTYSGAEPTSPHSPPAVPDVTQRVDLQGGARAKSTLRRKASFKYLDRRYGPLSRKERHWYIRKGMAVIDGGYRQLGHAAEGFKGASLQQCKQACLTDQPRCRAFNWGGGVGVLPICLLYEYVEFDTVETSVGVVGFRR